MPFNISFGIYFGKAFVTELGHAGSRIHKNFYQLFQKLLVMGGGGGGGTLLSGCKIVCHD